MEAVLSVSPRLTVDVNTVFWGVIHQGQGLAVSGIRRRKTAKKRQKFETV